MPSKNKNTPTKESDEAAAAAAEIADLKAQLAAALQAQPPSGGIITTPAPAMGSNNPWGAPGRNMTLPLPSVAPQVATTGPARTLALEEKEDTLRRVTMVLQQKSRATNFIISPKYTEGITDSLKLMRRVISNDTDFDHAAFVQTVLSVISTFAGRPLSPAHVAGPALEQLAVVLAAQRVANVYTEHGVIGDGHGDPKALTEDDVLWLAPIITYLQAPTVHDELSIPIDECRAMPMPSPIDQPNAYVAVAELNGFMQSLLAVMREQLQQAGTTLSPPGLAVSPFSGIDTTSLATIKTYITDNRPPVQTKDAIREAVNRFTDDVATMTSEVTSGVLKVLYTRASALKSDLVDFQAQGLSTVTDFGMVNDIQLMINIGSMLRALRYNAITMEHQLGDGHSKYAYRETSDKILRHVETALEAHASDNLVAVTTLVSVLPSLITTSDKYELTTFTDFISTFGKSKSRAKNYRDLVLEGYQKVKNDPPRVKGSGSGGGGGPPSPKPGGGGRGSPGGRGSGSDPATGGRVKSDPNCQVIVRLDGKHDMRWDEIKRLLADIVTGLQHVGVPASKDHFYATFNSREEAIKAKNMLQGATWGAFKLTTSLVVPDSRANRAQAGIVLNTNTSSSASDDDDARSTASGYSDTLSVAGARRASADADAGSGPVLKITGSTLENLRESLNLSNDTTDAISVLPDGQLRLEMAGDGGAEDQELPP